MIAAFWLGVRSLRTPAGVAVAVFGAVIALLVSTALGVAAMLPSALSAGAVRQSDRYPVTDGQALRPFTGPVLSAGQRDTLWHGEHVGIVEVADAAGVTPPPGVATLPGAGHSVVSPRLAALLRSDHTGLLAARVPSPVGTIGPAGLQKPEELFAYVGVARADLGQNSISVLGWGPRGGTLFRSDISPYVALPIAVLVVAPILALLSGLLQLDERRRTARLAGLAVLGATRAQRLAADAGALMLPVLAGWAIGWPLSQSFDVMFAEHATAGRLFFGTDLQPSTGVRLGILALLMLVAGSLLVGENDPDASIERIEGNSRYRVRPRVRVATALVGVGVAAMALTLSSHGAGVARSAGWIFGSAALLVAGVTVGLPVLILGLCRATTRGGVAGELARARLASTRSSWRSSALSLLLAGAVGGTSLSVLTVLDAAAQSDQIIWHPAGVSTDTVYASLPARDLLDLTRTGQFGAPVAVIPAGDATITGADGTKTHAEALYVPCVGLAQIIGLPPGADPCHFAWVTLDALNPHTPTAHVTLPTGHETAATSVRTGAIRAPAGLIGGSQSVLIPTDPATIHRALSAATDNTVHAVFSLHSAGQVERLRNLLWQQPAPPFTGAVGPLSTVVSKPDLIADSHRYTDNYSRLVLALLVLGSGGALIAAGLAGAVDTNEQARRNALLTALGAKTTVTRQTIRLSTYLPAVTATACGLMLGLAIGVAYLDLGDYPQLTGPLHGYPLRNLMTFGGIQLLAFILLATPTHLLATRRARTIEATTLTGI